MGKYNRKLTVTVAILLVAVMLLTVGVSANTAWEDHDPNFFDDLGILQELNRVDTGIDEDEELPEDQRDPTENLDYMKLLNTLGLLEGDENNDLHPYRTITRAELIAVVLRLAGVDDEYFMNVETGKQNFSDVPTDSWYYGAVKTACDAGIVGGYTDGTFKPDQTVSFNEALKLVICAIGYGGIAEEEGSYPFGYISVANKLKISKNLTADSGDKTLRKTVGKMLYNALFVKTLNRTIDGKTGNVGFAETGVTVGEKYFGIIREKGIINGVNEQMLGGVSERENVVFVSNEAYTSSLASEMKEHIGAYAEIFVTAEDDAKKEIVYYSLTDDNSVITVEFDDIKKITEEFVETDSEVKKIKLADEPSMLFNERAVVPCDYDLIKPDYYDGTMRKTIPYSGSVTFTDNNGDGKYDVINVTAYRSMYIGKALGLKKTLMDYYVSKTDGNDVMDLNPRNLGNTEVEYVMENGKEASFSSLKAGYVADIYSSVDVTGMNVKIKIVISNKKITGKVNMIDDDYAEIGGTVYKISPYCKNTVLTYPDYAESLELGAKVQVALNANKEIVAVVTKSSSKGLGYMIDYGKSNDEYYAEIAATDGKVKKYVFDENIKVNGQKASKKDALKLIENTGKSNAPVSFDVNAQEKLRSIDIYELQNPGLVKTLGVGKKIKIDASVLNMGDERYTHTFEFENLVDLDNVPIIGIDFGAAGTNNSKSPESGNAFVEGKNTVKIDKSYIGENRNDSNYSNLIYEDRIYLVNYDAAKETCDMIIFNVGSGGIDENGVMIPYTLYRSSGGWQNRFMSVINAVEYDSKASDYVLCVNKAYSTKNEDGETVWIVKGMHGGREVTYNTAPNMKYLTSMNFADKGINSVAPVQWSAERGATYAESDMNKWFKVTGTRDFYNPSTNEFTYAGSTSYYFPERFRTADEPGIKTGDMAFISTNTKGEIVEFQYVANAVDGPERTLCGRPRRASMVRGYCWEPFYGMDKDTMDTYYSGNHTHADLAEADISESIRTTAWDGENKQFISCSRDDIYGCDVYISEIDENTDGYTRTGEDNNCWLLMNKYNWECSEIIFVDYISNTY